MPTKAKEHPEYGEQVMLQHWTRQEQIDNAIEAGTIDLVDPETGIPNLQPPLTEEEKDKL